MLELPPPLPPPLGKVKALAFERGDGRRRHPGAAAAAWSSRLTRVQRAGDPGASSSISSRHRSFRTGCGRAEQIGSDRVGSDRRPRDA